MTLHPLRVARPRAAAALLTLFAIVPIAAVAVGSESASAPSISLSRSAVSSGQAVEVRGRAGRGATGRSIVVQYAAAGAGWRRIATVRVRRDGTFRARARPLATGSLRAILRVERASAASTGGASVRRSRPRRVSVRARLAVAGRRLNVVAGGRASVAGRLAPRTGGRVVRLEVRRHGRWRAVSRTRTGRHGGFRVSYRPRSPQSAPVRVSFAGDRRNTAIRRGLGRLEVFRYARVSWYGPGLYGNRLGCGGRLGYSTMGVANKTLPCGTRLTLRYRGREVRVRVIDRGPYVRDREYDLTAATARRLHFGGVGAILTTR